MRTPGFDGAARPRVQGNLQQGPHHVGARGQGVARLHQSGIDVDDVGLPVGDDGVHRECTVPCSARRVGTDRSRRAGTSTLRFGCPLPLAPPRHPLVDVEGHQRPGVEDALGHDECAVERLLDQHTAVGEGAGVNEVPDRLGQCVASVTRRTPVDPVPTEP